MAKKKAGKDFSNKKAKVPAMAKAPSDPKKGHASHLKGKPSKMVPHPHKVK